MFRRNAVALSLAVSLLACKTSMKKAPDIDLGKDVTQRAKLIEYSTYGDNPELLPGKVIVVRKKDGKCPEGRIFTADALSLDTYLLQGQKPKVKTLSNVLYQGAVKRGDKFNLVVTTFAENLSGSYGVEVIATDIREAIGEPILDVKKIEALQQKPMPADVCARVLVKNVRVSLVHWKSYGEATSGTSFTGTAFGFGNEIYSTESYFQPAVLVSMDITWLEAPALQGLVSDARSPRPREGQSIAVRLPAGGELPGAAADTY